MKDKFRVFGNDYRINRLLAKIVFLSMFILIFPQIVWVGSNVVSGVGVYSFSCVAPEGSSCLNPFFDKCDAVGVGYLCYEEFVPSGFVYNPLPWFYDLYQFPVLFLFAFFLLFNHFRYNKNFEWGRRDE